MLNRASSVSISSGTQYIIYFLISVIVIAFFLLANLNKDIEFKSTVIFEAIYVTTFLAVLVVSQHPKIKSYIKGKGTDFFYTEDLSVKDIIIFVPVGFLGAVGMAILGQNLSNSDTMGGLFALLGSGIIMGVMLVRTGSIIVPILVHGFYNSFVIVTREFPNAFEFIGLNPQSLPIPEIGIPIINRVASEMIFHMTLVAPAEEFFKIALMFAIIVPFRIVWSKSTIGKYGAMLFAVVVWMFFHLLQSF